MSGRTVIVDREVGARRLLYAMESVADQHLELALDTDTGEQYRALAQADSEQTEDASQGKGKWIIQLYKTVGITAACLLCVVMLFEGMFTGGATEYIPPVDLSKEIIVTWGRDQYRSLRDEETIVEFELPKEISEDMIGKVLTYLAMSGGNQYESVNYQTSIVLYVYEGDEDIVIFHDQDHWIYLVRVQE